MVDTIISDVGLFCYYKMVVHTYIHTYALPCIGNEPNIS